jgi:hypothetical protein
VSADFIGSKSVSRHSWLVEEILVSGQPAIIGGPPKALKTSIALDLAVSLVSGCPFLGRYPVPGGTKVAVFSGESGVETDKETLIRIATARGLDIPDVVRFIKDDSLILRNGVPPLGDDKAVWLLKVLQEAYSPRVIILDPLYKCLTAGSKGVNQASMFDMGPLLHRLAGACEEFGSTLVLVHHSTKALAPGKVMKLEDLAFAGLAEFARQWILINRRKRYRWDGRHELVVNVGGSAGHSSALNVTVEEGLLDKDFTGRKWLVSLEPHVPAQGKQETGGEGRPPARDKAADHRDRVLAALDRLTPESPDGWVGRNEVRKAARLNNANMQAAVERLLKEGEIEEGMTTRKGRPAKRLRRQGR